MHHPRLAWAALALLAACGGDPSTPPDDDDNGGGDGDVLAKLASGSDCPEPSGGPTEHSSTISADETWLAADGPHEVTFHISIQDGAQLTIEPCAEVRLAAGVSINVSEAGSALVARGEIDGDDVLPVRFIADGAAAWGSISVTAPATIDLALAALIKGASAASFQDDAGALEIRGSDSGTLERIAKVEEVLIRDAEGLGLSLSTYGAFTTDSDGLTIDGAGNEDYPYPVRAGVPAVGSLPEGSYTGNATDEIQVDALREIAAADTFKALGVPYRVGPTLFVRGPSAGAPEAVLTIEAGVTVRFEPESRLFIGDSPGRLGALVAEGTAAAPIVFTSAAAAPAPGDWVGLLFDGSSPSGNQLSHVVIEYAGGNSTTSSYGCGPNDNDSSLLITEWRPSNAFLQDSTIRHGGGFSAVVLGWSSDLDGPDFVTTNTFTDVPACRVARWKNVTAPVCPGNDSVDDCL